MPGAHSRYGVHCKLFVVLGCGKIKGGVNLELLCSVRKASCNIKCQHYSLADIVM